MSLPAGSYGRRLRFATGPVFDFGGSDPAALGWLCEFFGPALVPAEAEPGWTLLLEPSAQERERVLATRPSDPDRPVCLAFDAFPVRLATWELGGALVIDDEERGCVIVVRGRELTFIGSPEVRRWRFSFLLVLQELIAAGMRSDHLQIHAATVERNGVGLVIAGPKMAGKTTTMMRLLRAGGWALMGNDRAFARAGDSGAFVHAVPLGINLREDTVEMYPDLRLRPRRLTRPYLHTTAELEAARGPAPSVGKRSDALTPAQFTDSLGAERAGSAPVGAFVFSAVRDDVEHFDLERLGATETEGLLEANVWGTGNPPTLFSELAGTREPEVGRLATDLAGAVTGYRLGLGRGAIGDDGLAEALAELTTDG